MEPSTWKNTKSSQIYDKYFSQDSLSILVLGLDINQHQDSIILFVLYS